MDKDRVKSLLEKNGLAGVNKPKKTPSHPTKKGVVLAKEGETVKLIRFGDQKMGHNYSPEARKSFKARHAKNINNKLKNNGGWGLVEMLILSGILLLALLFAAYLIYKLYSNF